MVRTRYRLSFPEPHRHLVDVEARFAGAADVGPEVDLHMAAWTPGSYLVREYARHVQDLAAADEAGRPLGVTKVDKATWRVRLEGARDVVLRYRVYAHELTVRTSHVDATHAYLNGAPTYLWIEAWRGEPAEVEIERPRGWQIVTQLAGGPERFVAADLDDLIDSPIHVGPEPVHELLAAGRPARLVVWGPTDPGGVADHERLVADTARIVEAHARVFGGLPVERYDFIVLLTPGGYGGLEHRRSCSLLGSSFDFHTPKQYERLLELVSHEFFHAWNVKRIRPRALGPFAYDREVYTRSLWVMEGVTSYYDGYTLRRAALQPVKRYLEKIAEEWGKLLAVPGRAAQSLEEASFDAWIKLYRPDESTANTTVSYYLKGGLAALALDLEIRRRSEGRRSLDDVMRHLWATYGEPDVGFDDADVQLEMERGAGLELGRFFDRVVRGREDPDLAGELAGHGLTLKASWNREESTDGGPPAWLGANLRTEEGRLRVAAVLAGGPADRDGLSPGDEIIALDGLRVDERGLERRIAARRPGDPVRLTIARRDALADVRFTLGERPRDRYEIVPDEGASEAARALRVAWLGE